MGKCPHRVPGDAMTAETARFGRCRWLGGDNPYCYQMARQIANQGGYDYPDCDTYQCLRAEAAEERCAQEEWAAAEMSADRASFVRLASALEDEHVRQWRRAQAAKVDRDKWRVLAGRLIAALSAGDPARVDDWGTREEIEALHDYDAAVKEAKGEGDEVGVGFAHPGLGEKGEGA